MTTERRQRGDVPARQAAVELLSTGQPYRQAADAVGVSERTVRRWMSEPAYRLEVDARRSEMFAQAAGQAASLLDRVFVVLGAALASLDPAVRLAAARLLLSSASSLHGTLTVRDEMNALQEMLHAALAQREGDNR